MKRQHSRRQFLKNTSRVSLGFLGLNSFLGSSLLSCRSIPSTTDDPRLIQKYGPVVPDPEGILNLPAGFTYKIIARKGQPMNDGFFHPDKPDGMATFSAPDGRVIIVRNHELLTDDFGPFGEKNERFDQLAAQHFYDHGHPGTICKGGTTTLVFNEQSQEVEMAYLSLAGTLRNCAGGRTPWNTWITCEEIFVNENEEKLQQNHGYNFEVPASASVVRAEPIPLKAMGRFNHEAVCVDPKTGIVYQTEDQHDGLFYRFIPYVPGQLRQGGRLQALAVKGQKSLDTRNWETANIPTKTAFAVEWIDMEEVDPQKDELRLIGFDKGAARFARGEGTWFGQNELFFACTNGGATKTGQVFRYRPSPYEGTPQEQTESGQLELFLEPNNTALLQHCDNLTIAPWGDVILCEDRAHPNIVGVTPQGQYYRLSENIGFSSEFAGGVFSPSGKTFFVNIQHAGLTLAIQGPWTTGVVG
ncbi:MAG: alkaline phosphatase PhoX [Bacteroidota bacterium]